MNLLTSCRFLKVEGPATGGTSTLTSDAVDLSGWGGVVFVASLGDVTTGCALALKAHHSHLADSEFVVLEDHLEHTADGTDADNKLLVMDVSSAERRYVRVTLERGAAIAVLNGIIAVLYRPNAFPTEQLAAHVLAAGLLVAPRAA